MPVPKTTRLEPTILAIGFAAVICTTGMPAFSSSVVIAAPLRVLVPHVEVRMIGIDAVPFDLFRYLSAEAARVRQRIRSAASRNEFGMQFADDAVFLHLAHGVERHQPVGIFLHESGVVAAVGNFIVFPAQIIASLRCCKNPNGSRRCLRSDRDCP